MDADILKEIDPVMDLNEFETFAVEKTPDGNTVAKQRSMGYKLYASRPGILSVVLSFWVFEQSMGHGLSVTCGRTYDLSRRRS